MAHNAHTEDYQRLALRYVMATDASPSEAMAAYGRFWRDFARNRDALPQTDADRAFHLVALATDTLDYKLPFATDEQVDGLISRGRALLDEALMLDPSCHDARRMLFCLGSPSFDERYAFLLDHKDEVKRACMDAAAETQSDEDDERGELAVHLATYPYLRWLAALADHALVCGHNTSCINYSRELLELDPTDLSDVRFTLSLCYAKMDDLESLATIGELIGPGFGSAVLDDAWSLIARMALAYKACHYSEAQRYLDDILAVFPRAEEALMRQTELPDGLFARIRVAPYSEDELILALSEATVLTQEGADDFPQGPFGLWILDTLARRHRHGGNAVPGSAHKWGGSR